ncbi:MAG: L,D-transpeptidase [Candidatus Margulisbacteria bacterium]|nr:L,D-transpeptidase [Candidatus Margulisiibacteriota bacterium]
MKLLGISLILTGIAYASLTLDEIFKDIPSTISTSDYVFVVDVHSQKNFLFYKNTLIDHFMVSTGSKHRYKGNREMREGVWRLSSRMNENLAPIYGARLIYLEKYNKEKQKFVRTNRAFHGTNEPENIGQPTSMGCVYHFDQDIIDLYEYIPKDTLVITKKMIGDSFKGSNINVSLLPL